MTDTTQNPNLKNFAERALSKSLDVLATAIGIDPNSMLLTWNANSYRSSQMDKSKPKTYPFGVVKVNRIARNENFVFKKMANVFQHGAVTSDGKSRPAIKLLPVTLSCTFKLITDNPNQAMAWACQLLSIRETHDLYDTLSFALVSKLYPTIKIPTQLVLESEGYDIQDIEYGEDVPMEYAIEGEFKVHTRNSDTGLDVSLISTFDVYSNVDPKSATNNVDGTTQELFTTSTGKPLPIVLRTNI